MFTKATVTALLAGAAAAYTPPKSGPTGNAINAPLIEIVPACKPYTIKWTPTLPADGSPPNKISLLLLKGPSSNVVFDSVIADSIDNTGSFTWTPPSTVEATAGPGGYGIQLVEEITGKFQYSTQFGFSKEACGAASSSSVAPSSSAPAPSETPSGYAHSTPAPKPTSSVYATKPSSSAYETPAHNSTSAYSTTSKYVAPPVGTGSPNSTVVYPTVSMSVPETLKTSSTAAPSSAPQPSSFPGAASGLQAGLGLAGAVAALVAML